MMLALIIIIFNILAPAVAARVICLMERATGEETDMAAVVFSFASLTLVQSLVYNHFDSARWVEIIGLWSVFAGLCLMFYTLTSKRCTRDS